MATTFLEPGGDADFAVAITNGFWGAISGAPAVATDFVHGNHQKSIKLRPTNSDRVTSPVGTINDTGTRISFYLYVNTQQNASAYVLQLFNTGGNQPWSMFFSGTSSTLILYDQTTTYSLGSVTLGTWNRISIAYTITSTTVNVIKVWVNGVLKTTQTNVTLVGTSTDRFSFGNLSTNATLDMRLSDIYIDNSSSLTDTGDIWVTAKRPNANGTTNDFTTQIGSGGSGYGSGHSPQVNERALSTTNGWSIIGAGSAVTEEYNIESKSAGDIDISTATIIDYMGWVSAKALTSETGQIVVDGVSTSISLTSTNTLFRKIKGSTSYPAGTGTDIGIVTDTTVTTVSLYECGVIVAYIPGTPPVANAVSNSSAGVYIKRQVMINGY